jgi:hypothetical protein
VKIEGYEERLEGKSMKRKVLAFWLLLLCFFPPPCVESAGEKEAALGKMERLKGEVSVLRQDGCEVKGESGLALHAGDQITTGKGAEVHFILPPGRQFRLGPESQVSIDELSASEEEDQSPVLRLALGFLRSKIEKLTGKPVAFELHTPTAVLGLRGTEFDTVVSLDAASLVAVDEGKVEVDADGAMVLLDQGKMTEVEFEEKPSPPSTFSRERDWQDWREKRVERSLQRLPRMVPRLRHRFEQAAVRAGKFAETVQVKGESMRETMREVRAAKQRRDRPRARESFERLREQVEEFRKMAARFRQGLNRFRVMGRLSVRQEQFVKENRTRFPERQVAFMQTQFAAIAQKREALKEAHGKAISTIQEVFRGLRAFREEMGPPRGAAGSS